MNTVINKVENILKSEYTISDFVEFVQEVFSTIEFVAPDKFNKEYSNFSSHIEGSTHVGNYTDPEGNSIIIAAVQLKSRAYVENSRSVQRNYAKKLIENAASEAAFIAFYTEDESKWRISFVRLDYEMKFENGKMKASENLTPAKRYSYLVGRDEPCHTAIDRFKIFIEDNNSMPTLDQMEDVFSVEAVTNEFFKLYCEKFHQVREHLESNEDFVEEAKQHNFTAAQFTKKLMGQIVFLYFLQKKGWLGVNALPKTMTEKEYKNAFFARGAKSRSILPVAYRQNPEDGFYYLMPKGLATLNDEDETILAQCVKGQPWGTGPKNFMRKLFETSQKKGANFFDDYLEPLFYNALNVNRGEQGYDPILHCRIPFLSGGLFEPIDGYEWEYNDFGVPNELFSNRINNNPRTGDGILDIFDRYNFTMSEDEPLEREVAIDPEMLGKVFENLLDVNDRKSKGAFYTPREIVHYMCQESLINYLTKEINVSEAAVRDFILYGDFMNGEDTVKEKRQGNGNLYISEELYKLDNNGNVVTNRLPDMDKALAEVRVADPAVGSGAFPLGMLNEIVRTRQNISAYYSITMNPNQTRLMYSMERSPYALKYQTIKNCIYAADIEPSAVDIAQLRLWLSLVIDDEINPNADPNNPLEGHRNPTPLPNLECNILCGNSLIDEFERIKLINQDELLGTAAVGDQTNIWGDSFSNILPRLIDAQDRLFRCDDTNKKHEILNEISAIKDMIILSQMECADSEIVERYKESKKLASKPYVLWQLDFARVFKEKGGFDIVIGNPPYVGEKGNKDLFRPIAATSFGKRFYNGKMDLFYFFFHKAIDLGNDTAEIAFITTNYYPTAFGGKKLREDFRERTQIRKLINFNELKVFESALGQHNMITLLTKTRPEEKTIYAVNTISKLCGYLGQKAINDTLYTNTENNEIYELTQNELYDGEERYIRLNGCNAESEDSINSILKKIASGEYKLADVAVIKQGIVSGADKYTDAHEKKYGLGIAKGTGIFVLSKNELEQLGLPEKELKYVKRVYKNSNISKYTIDYPENLYTLYITKEVNPSDVKYIIKHLEQFRSILQDKREVKNGRLPWYSMHWPREKTIFENPEKIVNSRRAKGNIFALETKKCYEQSDIMITTIKEQYKKSIPTKYVLALLNSKLMFCWLKYRGKLKGETLELYGKPLEEIPIKVANESTVLRIVNLVDQIIKNKSDTADIDSLFSKIDSELYSLYGFSKTEISIIEKIACVDRK